MNAAEAIRIAETIDPRANYALRATGDDWHIYHISPSSTPTIYLGLLVTTHALDKSSAEVST